MAPLRAVHISFIVTSRGILRDLGYFERYVAQLSPPSRVELETIPAGVWVPVELARAHLEACDRLGMSEVVQLETGRRLATRLHGPVLRTALRLAGAAGATPMLLAAKAVHLWPQRNDGGDLLIVHEAQNEARIELLGYTLADIPYFRTAWRGNLQGNARLVLPRANVVEVTQACTARTLAYSMTW